jgi:Resolvase, N terminal domain
LPAETIRSRKIDVIVVYKVDRLTRSLADFAKLVELFDAHGVSFVSVTQQFNTTTSMGRLTLNVLLSFAQFEREVTSERIRDKVAASKRKGLLFDDAGHRMIPTHATKAGIRYRYYVSTPVLHGEAKTASAGSVTRVPAADTEDTVVKSLKKHLANKQDGAASSVVRLEDRDALAQLVAGIVVHSDQLVIQLKSANADEASDSPDDQSLSIPWQKPPSKRSRQILLPHNAFRSNVRPEQFERRAHRVSAIARGRRWLGDVVSGRVTTIAELCVREKCSARKSI